MVRKFFAVCALAALCGSLALAADESTATEGQTASAKTPMAVGVFAGYLLGDQVSESTFRFFNQTSPLELDDATGLGVFFTTAVSPKTDFELRLGMAKTKFLNVPTRQRDEFGEPKGPMEEEEAFLYYLNVGFVPSWTLGSIKLGIPFGFGWGQSSPDQNLAEDGTIGLGESNGLDGGGGMLIYAGLQASYPIGERWTIVADARLQRFHRLVNVTERSAKLFEFAIGIKRSF